MSLAEDRVAEGAQFMDTLDRDWWQVVDIDTLDMGSTSACVGGQWAEAQLPAGGDNVADFRDFVDAFDLYEDWLQDNQYWTDRSIQLGFDSDDLDHVTFKALRKAWINQILWREYLEIHGKLP